MKSNKFRILTLALVAVLAQGTCAYAASDDDYDKDELENLTPGWSTAIDKSNYKVDSYTNTFSSPQTEDKDEDEDEEDSTTTTTTTATTNIDSNVGNIPVSTIPSTGRAGDFWGKTSVGKWILLEQGVPVSGWKMVRGKWYYMNPDGIMQTGWVNDGDKWYFLNSGGDMAYNKYIGNYYVGADGAMLEA